MASESPGGDGKTQTLETMLPDIIAGLNVMLATRAAERERRAEEARRQAEWARRRELASKRQAREKRRVDYLNKILSCRDEVTRLQSSVDQFPEGGASADVDAVQRLGQTASSETGSASDRDFNRGGHPSTRTISGD